MVDRSHVEDSLPSNLERSDLHDDRNRLQHEYTPHDHEKEFLFGHHSHRAKGGTQSERANISHKYLGRIGIKPEEAQACTNHGTTEDRQFPTASDIGNLKVISKPRVSSQITKKHECTTRHEDRADGEAIQPIRQIDGIGCGQDDKHNKGNIEPSEVRCDTLKKGEMDSRVKFEHRHQNGADDDGCQHLEHEFVASFEPSPFATPQFEYVIRDPDDAKKQGGRERQPDKAIGQIRPQKGGDNQCCQDEDPTHGRDALLA